MAKLEDRCLLVLGMPGVGKSLLVTQLRSGLRPRSSLSVPAFARGRAS
jgi:GTPase SAR1 family protein